MYIVLLMWYIEICQAPINESEFSYGVVYHDLCLHHVRNTADVNKYVVWFHITMHNAM